MAEDANDAAMSFRHLKEKVKLDESEKGKNDNFKYI